MLAPRRRILQQARSTAITIAAPTLGWNARDSLAAMNPQDAVYLENMFPAPTAVHVRLGHTHYATGISGQVETLMQYSGGVTERFFAAARGNIYNVTNGGAVGNYLSLPGTAGNYASTPDSSALDITGDIELIGYAVAADWTPAGTQEIISKADTTGNQRSYRMEISTAGLLQMAISTNGTSNIAGTASTVAINANNGIGKWLRTTLDVDDGAGNRVFKAYTSDDPPSTAPTAVTWTQLGATVTTAGTVSIFVGTADLEVGSLTNGTLQLFNGSIYSAYVYSGIGGTLVASFNANDTFPGDTSWPSLLTGETWTANGTAAIVGTLEVTGLTNARWQYVNNTTAGGNYIQAVNGADKMRVYDGTAWHKDGDGSPYDVTGVDSSTCINIALSHNRVWLTQIGNLKAWYGPTGAIGGAFNALDLSSFADRGGYLMGVCDWTMDAGYGMDDMTVFVTSEGQVLVYKGSDPSSATTWALIGVYWIGSPIGRRFYLKLAGDILLITQDGVVSMAAALQSSRVNPKAAISNKIQNAISSAISLYGSNFGWQLVQYPAENMLILNVPFQEGQSQQQYVMSTIKRGNGDWAWCNFTGWQSNCWELWQDNVYFGGAGFVALAWDGYSDNGSNIPTNGLQAFNNFGDDRVQKRFTMMRPILQSNGSPSILAQMNVDFDLSTTAAPLSFTPTSYAVWDTGVWDTSLWGGDLVVLKDWQGCTGTGYWAGPHLTTATMGIDTYWINTTVVFEKGAIL